MNPRTTLAQSTVALLCLVSLLRPAYCDDKDKLVGSWKLIGFKVQAKDTKQMKDALGPNPSGRLILTANGYVTNYRVAGGRKPAETDAERAQLLRTTVTPRSLLRAARPRAMSTLNARIRVAVQQRAD